MNRETWRTPPRPGKAAADAASDLDPALGVLLGRVFDERVDLETAARHLWVFERAGRGALVTAARRGAGRVMVGVLTTAVLFAFSGAAVAASGGTLPGDLLYTVKRGTEQARLLVAITPEAHARVLVDIAEARLAEARAASLVRPEVVQPLLAEAEVARLEAEHAETGLDVALDRPQPAAETGSSANDPQVAPPADPPPAVVAVVPPEPQPDPVPLPSPSPLPSASTAPSPSPTAAGTPSLSPAPTAPSTEPAPRITPSPSPSPSTPPGDETSTVVPDATPVPEVAEHRRPAPAPTPTPTPTASAADSTTTSEPPSVTKPLLPQPTPAPAPLSRQPAGWSTGVEVLGLGVVHDQR